MMLSCRGLKPSNIGITQQSFTLPGMLFPKGARRFWTEGHMSLTTSKLARVFCVYYVVV